MSALILEHLKPFTEIIWDWNGTLLNDRDISFAVEAELFPMYGVKPPTQQQRAELFCHPIETYYERIGFDLEKHSYAEISNVWLEIYERKSLEAKLFDGIHETLAAVHAEKKRQFILSAAPQTHLEVVTTTHKIDHYFQGVYGLSDALAASKIHRGHDLMHEQNIQKDKAILIGDTSHDFEVAEALGIEVLLIADGHNPFEKLAKLHHRVLASRI
jgi:phosphoglycolate phosphatase